MCVRTIPRLTATERTLEKFQSAWSKLKPENRYCNSRVWEKKTPSSSWSGIESDYWFLRRFCGWCKAVRRADSREQGRRVNSGTLCSCCNRTSRFCSLQSSIEPHRRGQRKWGQQCHDKDLFVSSISFHFIFYFYFFLASYTLTIVCGWKG